MAETTNPKEKQAKRAEDTKWSNTESGGDDLEKRVEHGKENEEPKLAEDQASVAGTD
jgi:hypothetical protein